MSAAPKAGGRDPLADLPDLMDHRAIAKKLGLSPRTIRAWLEGGTWPRPHLVMGARLFYRVQDVRHRLTEGKWPPGMRFPGDPREE